MLQSVRPDPYAAPWYAFGPGGVDLPLSRRSHTIRVMVHDGTCFPEAPRANDAARRFHRAVVEETRYAVIVTVLMRQERPPPGSLCRDVGQSFIRRIVLSRPVGGRAVVDGSPRWDGERPAMRVPATDSGLRRLAEARYGPPSD